MRQLSPKAAKAVDLEVAQPAQSRQQMAHRSAEGSCRFKRLVRDGVGEEDQLLSEEGGIRSSESGELTHARWYGRLMMRPAMEPLDAMSRLHVAQIPFSQEPVAHRSVGCPCQFT